MPEIALDKGQVRSLIVEVRYWGAAEFFTKRGELIAASESESVVLRTQEAQIQIEDRTNRCTKKVGLFRSSMETEHIPTLGGFLRDMARAWLRDILSTMSVQTLRRIGVRQRIVFPYDGSFQTLVGHCLEQLYAVPRRAWDAIGGAPTDLLPRFDFDFGEQGAFLYVSATNRDQMIDALHNHEGLPEVGLFVDWDYYRTAETPANQVGRFLGEAAGHIEEKIVPFLRSLGGE